MHIKNSLYNIIVLIFSLIVSCSSDDNDVVNDKYLDIPDSHFESLLISQGIDTDGVINQRLLKQDAEGVSALNLNFFGNGEISDLTGIEGFINLKKLYAIQNALTTIDLSFNTKLDTLQLAGNYISSIDISHNPNLIMMDLDSNTINSITGLSEATQLKSLSISFNDLTEFSIHNESIETIFISDNFLESIDVTGAVNLKHLFLKSNRLTTVDLSYNTFLETLVLSDNQIQQLKLDQNGDLTHLFISSNFLANLDVSDLQKLIHLTVHGNPNLSCIKIGRGQSIPTVTKFEDQVLSSNCD